jgi:hypothetical protein
VSKWRCKALEEASVVQDAQGHHLSGATEADATKYDHAVRAFNLVHGDAAGLFDAAREAATNFTMAHLGKAWVLSLANDPVLLPQAKVLIETAKRLPMNEREQVPISPRLPSWCRAPGSPRSRCWTGI